MPYKDPIKRKEYQDNYNKIHKSRMSQQMHQNFLDKPDYYHKVNTQKLVFKGKQITLGFNPRTGICTQCNKSIHKGEIKKTNLHHTQYDDDDPLKHTIELCASCHYWKHHKNSNYCPQGHEFTKENSYFPPNGRRHCIICSLQSTRRWRLNKELIKPTIESII